MGCVLQRYRDWKLRVTPFPPAPHVETPLGTGARPVPAGVHVTLAYAAPEEALAAVAAGRSVVLPGRPVPTYGTQTVDAVVCGIHTCRLWGRTVR